VNVDDLTQRMRARFLGRVDGHEEVEAQHNRRSLRASGIQGKRGSITFKDGTVQGRHRGSFLGAGGRPAILVSNAPGWQSRLFARLDKQTARSRRTVRRMRANGEEVSA
jgi:hypothetical protein